MKEETIHKSLIDDNKTGDDARINGSDHTQQANGKSVHKRIRKESVSKFKLVYIPRILVFLFMSDERVVDIGEEIHQDR